MSGAGTLHQLRSYFNGQLGDCARRRPSEPARATPGSRRRGGRGKEWKQRPAAQPPGGGRAGDRHTERTTPATGRDSISLRCVRTAVRTSRSERAGASSGGGAAEPAPLACQPEGGRTYRVKTVTIAFYRMRARRWGAGRRVVGSRSKGASPVNGEG
jgi:hypothetical protein